MRRVGVLALQGAVSEHTAMLERCGARGVPVRRREDLADLHGLILPGGESTAISRLMRQTGLDEAVRDFAWQRPVLGTCAGMILCAREVEAGDGAGENPEPLGLLDITVSRNGFGRQVHSFEAELAVHGIGSDVTGVFIRAPYIVRAGDDVRVMAEIQGKAVMACGGTVMVTAFHPELTGDTRVMQAFLAGVNP